MIIIIYTVTDTQPVFGPRRRPKRTRIERNDDASDWARQHTEVAERQGPGPLDGSGAPVFEACSPGDALEAVDLRGGSPVDYYRCRCES